MERRNWDRSELIVAFHQYCITPFGQMHNRNREIIALAEKLGRTPSALSMKMCNFASLDPVNIQRNVKGLPNVSKADRDIWEEFNNNCEALLEAYQRETEKHNIAMPESEELYTYDPSQQSEILQEVKVRTTQSFFRRSVLSNYNYQCAMCRIDNKKLLNAGHIIPWSVDERYRADPQNGLSLCALHDRAFDRGLLTLDNDYRIVLADQIKKVKVTSDVHRIAFLEIEGQSITMPDKFAPSLIALDYHRSNIFGN